MINVTDVLRRPLITEKSTMTRELSNSVAFEVDRRANKCEIADAVEKLFKVKVVEVRTMVVPGKTKRRGRSIGRIPSWKKAIVTLKQGDTIEFFEGV
jgi:large subunit ribosomal protein L23